MKKRGMIVGAVLLSIAVIGGAAGFYFKQHHYQTKFSNDHGWQAVATVAENTWQIAEGGYQMDGQAENISLYTDSEYQDFQLTTEVLVQASPSNGGYEAGVLFRSNQQASNAYFFGLDVTNQEVKLALVEEGQEKLVIATKKMALSYDKKYQLTVKVSGEHLQCFVDEKKDSYPKIDVTDDSLTTGFVGVWGRDATGIFKELSVSDYQEPRIKEATYQNPLLPEIADPDVLYHEGTYYLYATTPGTNVGGIKVYTSKDLVNWEDQGLAMTAGPDNWGTQGFWAPDLIERDGKFYMYYTADEHLCVSVATNPLGPFKQIKYGPLHEDTQEIDAHAYLDEDGQYYLYFVRFTGGNVIWGAKLNDDMISIDEESVVEVLAPSQDWEKDIAPVNEGPYMLKKDGVYYLTYSGSHFESPMYGAGYATSQSPLGPFEKYASNPIMQSNEVAHGTGHHAVAESPDGKEMFMIYHRHQTLFSTDPREFCIDRMRFTEDENGATVLEVYGPTVTPQPMPSGTPK